MLNLFQHLVSKIKFVKMKEILKSSYAKASEDRPTYAKASEDRPSYAKASEDRPTYAKASEDRQVQDDRERIS